MNPKQSVFRVRRRYNQWVNNQTLEDYALRFTAKRARKFSFSQIANTALGSISFLALEAIGAALTLNYGFSNAALAIGAVSIIIFLLAIPICFHAAKSGLDIDLLTRGTGFGYIGSTITSLIYASFTFIFFALETAIMAIALEWILDIPLFIGYVICSLVVIPLVTHGITFISRFQRSTQLAWIFFQVIPIGIILTNSPTAMNHWLSYKGALETTAFSSIDLHHFGAGCAVIFALVAQIGEQVDYLRFMPKQNQHNKVRWWLTLFSAGPGWVVIGALKMLAGGLLATFAVNQGLSLSDAADPTRMYAIAFGQIISIPELSIWVAALLVIICQLKINVTNAYAGSIAWSNFFSRLTHSHPGRVVWLVFNVVIALVLMELGIYQAFEHILSGYGIIAIAWLGSVVADLAISKPLGLSPKRIEFIRAHLYAINPVGIGSMMAAVLTGVLCYSGLLGKELESLAHFVTLLVTLIMSPLLAYITDAKYFIARDNQLIHSTACDNDLLACCVCENTFEVEDMATCPAYEGNVCSLCCSLDARCDDVCKPKQHTISQKVDKLKALLPTSIQEFISDRLLYFIGLMLCAMLISGSLLSVIYINAAQQTDHAQSIHLTGTVIIQIFFVLQIALGVVAWLFVLANSSRRVAIEETRIQTQRLMDEISAHDETDRQLQLAKEEAEAANNAKSRYLTGLSHELRTPLNSVLGYAQLLESEPDITAENHRQISVIKRSGEHLADLIEGLLDISKIEAGRLDLHRNKVSLGELIEQLDYMFRPQAGAKGLTFTIHILCKLPPYVMTDEKRLRQILINLVSNAIKYTHSGSVELSVRYRNQVAEFTISDTGIGIPKSEHERIFKPFERVRTPDVPQVTGTGLGLTITRLLVDIMGGELRLENRQDSTPQKAAPSNTQYKNAAEKSQGSIFTVSLMMSSVYTPLPPTSDKIISGYIGPCKQIAVVDDDPFHRGLIFDALTPLGFTIFEAPDILFAKNNFQLMDIDFFILDVNLPDGSGLAFSDELRAANATAPILMISADAEEGQGNNTHSHNAYLIKPIKISQLQSRLEELLRLEWQYALPTSEANPIPNPHKDPAINIDLSGPHPALNKIPDLPLVLKTISTLSPDDKLILSKKIHQLEEFSDIGHVAGIRGLLENMTLEKSSFSSYENHLLIIQKRLNTHIESFDFSTFNNDLRALAHECER